MDIRDQGAIFQNNFSCRDTAAISSSSHEVSLNKNDAKPLYTFKNPIFKKSAVLLKETAWG